MTASYHIRHKTSGEYYKEFDLGYGAQFETTPSKLIHTSKGYGKSFKDLAKLKMHLLYLVGIFMPPEHILKKELQLAKQWPSRTPPQEYVRLQREVDNWHLMHPGYSNLPEWLYNAKPLTEVPQEWQVVEVLDKKAKIMNVVDWDPHAYVRDSLRLRVLTDNHGSAVRDVYKKLDKTNKLLEFAFVVAIQINPDTVDPQTWDPQVDVAEVNRTISGMGLKQNQMVRTSKKDSIAIAFKSQDLAAWFAMSYFGKDRVAVIDLLNLTQLVTPAKENTNG